VEKLEKLQAKVKKKVKVRAKQVIQLTNPLSSNGLKLHFRHPLRAKRRKARRKR